MALNARVSVSAGGVIKALKKARTTMFRMIQEIMRKEGAEGQRRIIERVTGSQGDKKHLHVRSGILRSTIGFRTEVGDYNVALELGTTKIGGKGAKILSYAAIHEYGGTIKPRLRKSLTIPMPAVLTPSGVARFSAREAMTKGKVPGLKSTFIRKIKGGKDGSGDRAMIFGIFQKVAKSKATRSKRKARRESDAMRNAKLRTKGTVPPARKPRQTTPIGVPVPLFLLVKKVVIPKRPYVGPERKVAFENIRQKLPQVLSAAMK